MSIAAPQGNSAIQPSSLGHKTTAPSTEHFSTYLTSSRTDDYPATPKDVQGYRFPNGHTGDAAAKQLSQNPQELQGKQAIYLADTSIGPSGAKDIFLMLMSNTSIKHVIMPRNPIFSVDIPISNFAMAALADLLKVNHHIGWLVLNATAVGDMGIKTLADGLKYNQGVKHLVLSDNDIGDEGLIYLADILSENTQLESFFLQGNRKISNAGVQALIDAIINGSSLKTIDLRDIGELRPGLKEELRRLGREKGIRIKLDD